MREPGEITRLLRGMQTGDKEAAAELFSAVYEELHKIAANMMRRERANHTLQATAVVHEAFLRLLGGRVTSEHHAQFYVLVTGVMRKLLVDHARRTKAAKRGDRMRVRVELRDDDIQLTLKQSEEVLAVDEALEKLQALDLQQAKIIEMYYFAGYLVAEIADLLGISERTVKRELQIARLFLKQQLEGIGMTLS